MSATEWNTSAMMAVEPVSKNATSLATVIEKSTISATATARVLVVMESPLPYSELVVSRIVEVNQPGPA